MAAQRGTDGAVEVHTSSLICIILLFYGTLVQDNPEMRIGYDRFLQKSENITDLLMGRF